MLKGFWDKKRAIIFDFLEKGATANMWYYGTMSKLVTQHIYKMTVSFKIQKVTVTMLFHSSHKKTRAGN